MNSRVLKKKLFDFLSPMDGGSIPQQDHGPPEMFEQFFKERPNIQTGEIPCPELQIKSQPSSFRGYRQRTDRGNPILFVQVVEDRSFPFWSPGTTNVWNEQEARLINEDQMGSKSFGVFLYAATGKPSNGQSLYRSFVTPGARVSDNSIPSPEATATHDSRDTGCESACGQFGRSASRSKGRSDNLRQEDPPKAVPLIFLSRFQTAWEDVPEWPSNEGPPTRPLGSLDTIGKRSFLMPPPNALLPKEWPCLLSATRWRVDGAFPIPLGIHGVSCPIL
jgi:hypothetical protein